MSELEFIGLWQDCFGNTITPLKNESVIHFIQWLREAKPQFPVATVMEMHGMNAVVRIELGGMAANAIYNGNGGSIGVGTKLYARPFEQ